MSRNRHRTSRTPFSLDRRRSPHLDGITRRQTYFSFLIPSMLPLLQMIEQEARLWGQEVGFYRHQLLEKIHTEDSASSLAAETRSRRRRIPPIDADFASAYLQALRKAAGPSNRAAFDETMRSLYARELPEFERRGACGHCGRTIGPAALKDHEFFDFQAYVYGKALLMIRCSQGPSSNSTEKREDSIGEEEEVIQAKQKCIDELRLVVGDDLLKHIFRDIAANDAEAAGISPGLSLSPSFDDLFSESPELANVRQALRTLLQYLRRSGGFALRVM